MGNAWAVVATVGIVTVAVLGFIGELWQCYSARRQDAGVAEECVRQLAPGEQVQLWARPHTVLGFTRRLWIATDKRLLLVWRRRPGDGRLLIAEVGYRAVRRIERVESQDGGYTAIVLSVEAGSRKVVLRRKKAEALLEVLARCAGLDRPARRSWWRR